MTDQINPDHYRSDPSGIECIEITRHRNFNVGNIFKYLWRAGLKTEQGKTATEKQIEDLEKAAWYINDEIQRIKNGAGERVFGGTLHPHKKEENMTTSDINEALRGVKEGTHELRAERGPELIDFANKPQTISELQKDAHAMAKEKGFWDDANKNTDDLALANAFISQKLALIHSEVTEALDEVRDNRPDWVILYAEDGKPEGLASELADVVIRTLDLAGWLAIDLESVIAEKMAYNKTRPAKHGKNF